MAEPPGGGPAGQNRPAETAAEDLGQKFGRHRRAVLGAAETATEDFGRKIGLPNWQLPIHRPPHMSLQKAKSPS